MNAGLVVKAITIKKSREGKNEPYLVVYAGSDASVQDGYPLKAMSRVIEGVPKGERFEFEGLGMLALPPIEVRGGLIAWHVELWESDSSHRDIGETMQKVSGSVKINSKLAGALTASAASTAAAITALRGVAESVAWILKANGDDLMLTWAGSLHAHQLESMAGAIVVSESKKAIVEFAVVVTEGEPAKEVQ